MGLSWAAPRKKVRVTRQLLATEKCSSTIENHCSCCPIRHFAKGARQILILSFRTLPRSHERYKSAKCCFFAIPACFDPDCGMFFASFLRSHLSTHKEGGSHSRINWVLLFVADGLFILSVLISVPFRSYRTLTQFLEKYLISFVAIGCQLALQRFSRLKSKLFRR